MRNKRRYRNLLINNKVQLRVVRRGFLHTFFALLAACFLLLFWTLLDAGLGTAQYAEKAKGFFFANEHLDLVAWFIPLGILLLLFIPLLLINTTHRYCGPFVNFMRVFRAVAKGDLSARVKLRDKDDLQEESRVINGMIDSLAQTIQPIETTNRVLLNIADETLTNLPDDPSHDRLRNALSEMRTLARLNNKSLSGFKFPE